MEFYAAVVGLIGAFVIALSVVLRGALWSLPGYLFTMAVVTFDGATAAWALWSLAARAFLPDWVGAGWGAVLIVVALLVNVMTVLALSLMSDREAALEAARGPAMLGMARLLDRFQLLPARLRREFPD